MYIELLIATQIFLGLRAARSGKKDGGEMKEREIMFII